MHPPRHRLRQRAQEALRPPIRARHHPRRLARQHRLDRGPLCFHARPHPFFLRPRRARTTRIRAMDETMEIPCLKELAGPWRTTHLAVRALGPPTARPRPLRFPLGICPPEPRPRGIVRRYRRLAVAGRNRAVAPITKPGSTSRVPHVSAGIMVIARTAPALTSSALLVEVYLVCAPTVGC